MNPLDELKAIVATRTRRLVIWVGAGLSAPAGIPTWQALQRRLETRLDEKLRELDVPDAHRESRVKVIKQEANPWVAFQRLQTELGFTSYREAIREALSKGAAADVPSAYRSAWALRPSGFINLNLDRLATRAFAEAGNKGLIEFKGKDVGGHAHTLNSTRPFLCNLHGVEDDVDSWVFTHDALKALADMESYQHYMTALLASTTVIFLGISADDVAVGGHLERIERYGLRINPHYWITDRRDVAGDSWAERNNVRIIRYRPTSFDHPELQAILADLESHVQPEAEPSPPVTLDLPLGSPAIGSVSDLVGKDAEQIRSELNSYASNLLVGKTEEDIKKYEDFSKAYDRAIHAAWYTSTESGENKFLGYELIEEVARGAFGIVFRAIDASGKNFAIKLLHAEIRKKRELLDAFRRGVRSLGILQGYAIDGVVGYVGASEIPATLIMDWIDGPNLNEVVQSSTLDEWSSIVEIAFQLTEVIANAHALPERVLHRDIRPPNMIVSNYWEDGDIKVKVLDFDLSWHRGSVEKSVIFGSQLSGYLAPEQVQRKTGVSTQHASVDSYGIGMTLFYMVAGRDPAPGEHAHGTWASTLASVVQRPRGHQWKSLPQRVARLINAATQEEQKKRWDVIQLRSELSLLRQTHLDPLSVGSVEMIAEELAARTPMLSQYGWDPEAFSIVKNFGTGLVVTIRGNEDSKDVQLGMRRVAGEADNRNRLGGSISRARDSVRDVLREAGWSVSATSGKGSLEVEASIGSDEVVRDFPKYVDSLTKAIERTQFQ